MQQEIDAHFKMICKYRIILKSWCKSAEQSSGLILSSGDPPRSAGKKSSASKLRVLEMQLHNTLISEVLEI